MAEALNFNVDYEKSLFPINPTDAIPEPNFGQIQETSDAFLSGERVVVYTDAPKELLEDVKITLDDHGVLYDAIKQKPEDGKLMSPWEQARQRIIQTPVVTPRKFFGLKML